MLKLAIYFHNKATIVMQKGHLDKQNVKLAWFFLFEQVFPPKEQRCFSNSASKQKSIHIHWLEKLIYKTVDVPFFPFNGGIKAVRSLYIWFVCWHIYYVYSFIFHYMKRFVHNI